MKQIWILLLPLVLIACGGENESADEQNADSNDTLAVVEDAANEELMNMKLGDFALFEDYALVHTRQQMIDVFGESNLEDDTAWFAEGTVMMMSTHVRNPETGHKVTYVFDTEVPDSVSFIEAKFQNFDKMYKEEGTQELKSETGLYTGMPLTKLETWNKGPITFSGFGWDYSGGVFPEVGSRLEKSNVNISLNFNPTVAFEGYQDLFGDVELKSTDENVKGAPIIISYMSLFVNDPMDEVEDASTETENPES